MDLIQEFNGLIFMASEIQEDVEAKKPRKAPAPKGNNFGEQALVTAAEKAG